MKFLYRSLAAASLLLLAACVPRHAVRQPADAGLLHEQEVRELALRGRDHWALQGRLYVSDGQHQSGTVDLSWSQQGAHYEFVVRTPITGRSFRLTGDEQGALLEGQDGGPMQGSDAEDLMQRALGWHVPFAELRAWVLGLRAGADATSQAVVNADAAQLQFGENRLPALLRQDGWSVDYRQWDTSRQPALPKVLFASKDSYKVKLSIESWSFP